MHLVLFGMQNRTLGPYLAAINRIPITIMGWRLSLSPWGPRLGVWYVERLMRGLPGYQTIHSFIRLSTRWLDP
jgi:hypothetical protein